MSFAESEKTLALESEVSELSRRFNSVVDHFHAHPPLHPPKVRLITQKRNLLHWRTTFRLEKARSIGEDFLLLRTGTIGLSVPSHKDGIVTVQEVSWDTFVLRRLKDPSNTLAENSALLRADLRCCVPGMRF
jgi:hypothetical protein